MMTTFVRNNGWVTEVRVASHDGDILYDGAKSLKPSDILFGKAARLIPDGVYDDNGNFISTLEEFVDYQS
jgi:hypothetical protein